jgi:hypothetical protein
MPRNFDFLAQVKELQGRGLSFWLLVAGGVLALANIVALIFFISPPGGSESELRAQSHSIQQQIMLAQRSRTHLQTVAGKVQVGSRQAGDFTTKYFLKRRGAYETVLAELQRMAAASGLQARDAVYSEEPVEGSADLTLLNTSANYEGTYEQLVQFLHHADQSQMLLMLDAVQASPQQRGGLITTSIRFQTIIRDEPGEIGGLP